MVDEEQQPGVAAASPSEPTVTPGRTDSTRTEKHNKTTSEVSESEAAASLDLAENNLFRFFRDGISSSSWTVFDRWDRIRVAYVGTHISNMSHLINLDRQRPQHLIYPHPEIRPPLPWKPDDNSQGRGIEVDIRRDVSCFPAKGIRDDLVNAFFEKINPYFPVVEEAEFRARYADLENKPPPLILLHAVLLAGAHVSRHPTVTQSRHAVKMAIFRQAKYVFDVRHETDRMNLVQAALLFTWHLQNGDSSSSNSYYWLGVACRIAFGLGMHRDLLQDPLNLDRMPLSDRRMWRRVWWTLFQAEIMSALEHGRPCMIRLNDFDQSPLTVHDLTEVSGTINSRIDFDYCGRNIELCHIALEVLELSAPRAPLQGLESSTTLLNSRLVSWMLNLAPSSNEDSFAGLNLRLHYHTVVIHLCRVIAKDLSSSADIDHEGTRRIAADSASAIISCLEAVHTNLMTAQCHFPAVTAVTAAAIHISKEIQKALRDVHTMSAVNQLQLLDRACSAAGHLSSYWPNAAGVQKVFKSLLEQFTGALRSIQEGHGCNEILFEDEITRLNWIDLLEPPWQMEYTPDVSQNNWNSSIFGLDRY